MFYEVRIIEYERHKHPINTFQNTLKHFGF